MNTDPDKAVYYISAFELLVAMREAQSSLSKIDFIQSQVYEAAGQVHNRIWEHSEGRTSTKFFEDVEIIAHKFTRLLEALNLAHENMTDEDGYNEVFSGPSLRRIVIDTLEDL